MFDVISPSESASTVHGVAEVSFKGVAGATRLEGLYQKDPFRVLFPRVRRGDNPVAALVTTSGGLVGGDRLDVRIRVGTDASATVLGQAAEKVYRTRGGDSAVCVKIDVGENAWLEYLPQETIVFNGARLNRITTIDRAPGARVMAAEIAVFGRQAFGEDLTYGLLRDEWLVKRDGVLQWADALHMDGDIKALIDHPAGFDGARSAATFLFAADDAQDYLDRTRTLLEDVDTRVGATLIGDCLIVRMMDSDTARLRETFGTFWAAFRTMAAGLPQTMHPLWTI